MVRSEMLRRVGCWPHETAGDADPEGDVKTCTICHIEFEPESNERISTESCPAMYCKTKWQAVNSNAPRVRANAKFLLRTSVWRWKN